MAITAKTYYEISCDGCHEGIDFDGVQLLGTSEQDAREQAQHHDWEITEDGTLTCSTCIENREEEEAPNATG